MADTLNHTPFKITIKKNDSPVAPQSPLKSAPKTPESEPVPSKTVEIHVEESKEKEIAPEVAEYIKKHDETVRIPQVLQEIGVVAEKDGHLKVVEGPTLPLTDQQISDGLKQPMSTSMRWLAQILLYWLQQAHFTIKVIHGSVKRVVKP